MTLCCEERFRSAIARALTLDERLQRHVARERDDGDANQQKRLQLWRSSFASTRSWAEFLRTKKISESELIGLRSVRNVIQCDLPWISVLKDIWIHVEGCDFQASVTRTIAEEVARPVVDYAWRELSSQQQMSGVFSPQAAVGLRRSLLHRLMFTAKRVLAWQMQVAVADVRTAQAIKTGHDFRRLFFSNGVSQRVVDLFNSHPALARLWAVQTQFWIQFTQDFARNAVHFGRWLGVRDRRGYLIASVVPDLSDLHSGNRSVLRVDFSTGVRYFYKSRSGQQELAWFALLKWINRQGFSAPFRILEVSCRRDHCWMEAASKRPFRTRAQIKQFYFRAGALMYLLHLLRGVDFHAENLIAEEDQPVVIDCETLLHPTGFVPSFARSQDQSILRTGLLPVDHAVEHTAFRGRSAVEVHGPAAGLDVGDVPAACFSRDIIAGFFGMHSFLQTKCSRIRHVASVATVLQKTSNRRIYRPSSEYYKFLEHSLAPSLTSNGLDRSIFLSAQCFRGQRPNRRHQTEISALENFDIPIFYCKSRPIRIELSEKTMARSVAIIRSALDQRSQSFFSSSSSLWADHGDQVQR